MSEQQFFKERPDTNLLLQIMQRYLPFWPLFVITISIGLAISWFYLRVQTRIYVANAKVLLKDPQKGGGDSKVLDALNIFSEKKIVENEIIVLRSSVILEEVVEGLDLYNEVHNQGKVRTEELYKGNAPVWFKAADKNNINGGGKYFFDVDWKAKRVNINKQEIAFNDTVNINGTAYFIVPNPAYNQSVTGKNYYVIFNTIASTAGSFAANLKANATSNSSTVIEVKLETPVPAKGVDFLNRLFEVYNYQAVQDKNQIAAKTLAFIEDRLNLVTGQLDSVEKNIQRYKTQESVYDLGSQASLYLSNVSELDRKSSDVQIQLDVLRDVQNYVDTKGRKPGTVPSQMLISDPTLAGLITKLYDAEFQLTKAESINGERSDAVILANQAVGRIKNDIRENLGTIRSSLNAVKSNVNSGIAMNNGLLSQVPRKERGLLDISRQQAIKNNIYTFLLQKREETALSSAGTTPDLRVLEKGSSYGPIKPVAKNFYLTGFLLGLLVSVAYVLLREQFNRKILFRSEIEEKTKVPVLAEIMYSKTPDTIAISEGKRTIIAEQFRSMRTNLAFMGINEEHKTLLVTSSISGEGKSFVALNLAMSFTLTGKKVGLMEMDLRKPKLSLYLGINRDPGITSYLIGKSDIDSIIKETRYPNLFVVSAGPIPPNPTELIISEKFGEMMTLLKEKFDYIIIDSAPIGPVTDSQLISGYANSTLYVVRHAHTPKVMLRMIDDLYKQEKFKNMALVFNGLKPRGAGVMGGYGYGYGSYGYGYGYGGGGDGYGYYTMEESKPGWRNGWGFFRKLRKKMKRS
ncbi:MAG: polysaccharide biosynthesis tyrosine autokinase [Ferruginibacter sp.]